MGRHTEHLYFEQTPLRAKLYASGLAVPPAPSGPISAIRAALAAMPRVRVGFR